MAAKGSATREAVKVTGSILRDVITRIETVREDKKQLADDEKAIFAEAKAAGFDTKTIRRVLTLRALEAGERAEQDALLNLYLDAIGMKHESPLVAAAGLMSVDLAAREQLIEAWKSITPMTGEIIVKVGGAPVRLFRDAAGEAQAEDYVEAPRPRAAADPDDPIDTGRTSKAVKSLLQIALERAEQTSKLRAIQGGGDKKKPARKKPTTGPKK